jgi:hypothetical protein
MRDSIEVLKAHITRVSEKSDLQFEELCHVVHFLEKTKTLCPKNEEILQKSHTELLKIKGNNDKMSEKNGKTLDLLNSQHIAS